MLAQRHHPLLGRGPPDSHRWCAAIVQCGEAEAGRGATVTACARWLARLVKAMWCRVHRQVKHTRTSSV